MGSIRCPKLPIPKWGKIENSKNFVLRPPSSVLILLLAWLLVACSGATPTLEPVPGIPPRTENISVKAPASGSVTLNLDMPAGDLLLEGTTGSPALLTGTIEYNAEFLKPVIEGTDTSNLKIRQNTNNQKLPNPLTNRWSLKLDGQAATDLSFANGNGKATLTTGDANLTKLSGKINNGDLSVTFDKAQNNLNDVSLEVVNGTLLVSSLSNAAPNVFNAKVGSGGITLDFTGTTLRRSFSGTAGIGNGDITLIFPAGVGVKITATITTGTSVNAAGFTRQGNTNTYLNADYPKGGNTITLGLGISNGNVKITTK